MGEFRSFFKAKGLNIEVMADPPKMEGEVKLVKGKKAGADRYRDKAGQLAYQRAWIAAKRRRLSEGQG